MALISIKIFNHVAWRRVLTHGLAVETLQWILDASKSIRDDRGRLLVRCRKGVRCEPSQHTRVSSLKRFGDANHRGIDGHRDGDESYQSMLRLRTRRTSNKTFCHICQSKSLGPHRSRCIGTVHSISLRRSTRITKFRHAHQQLLRPIVRADDHSGEVERSQMDEPQTRANRRSDEGTGTWDAFI